MKQLDDLLLEVNINEWLLHSVLRFKKNLLVALNVSSEETECTFRQLVNPAHCASVYDRNGKYVAAFVIVRKNS